MKKPKRIRSILLTTFIVIALFAIGWLSFPKQTISYSYSAHEMNEELILVYHATPDEALEWMNDSTKAVFVDIRTATEFGIESLPGAFSIPSSHLLEDENLDLFDQWKKDSLTVVLFGNDQLEANAPWMLIYQLGYNNAVTLLGGKTYLDDFYNDALDENASFEKEMPAFDFATIFAELETTPLLDNSEEKKTVVVRKKKKKAAEGGC